MMKTLRSLFPLLLISLLALLVGCQKFDQSPSANVATVNGEQIPLKEFMVAVTSEAGSSTLTRLVETRLILQEARKQGVTISDQASAEAVERIQFDIKDKDAVEVFVKEARANALVRALILKNVSETELRDTYQMFEVDLKRYAVSRIVLASQDTAKQVSIALETGSKFEQLAATSSLDATTSKQGGSGGFVTRRQLLSIYGPPLTKIILAMKPGEVSKLVHLSDDRYMILKLSGQKSRFEELRPYVENIFVTRDRKDFVYRLVTNAEIVSPFLPKEDGNVRIPSKEKAPSLERAPTLTPAPKASAADDYVAPLVVETPSIALPHENE